MKKPNIIVYFTDQQRFDTLGCNGQPLNVTPRLDQMAKEGVNFKRVYTPQPVCGPSRSILQSGLYPTQKENGCFRNDLAIPLDCNTLARRMKAAGYKVAYVGKWHLASDFPSDPLKGIIDIKTLPTPVERRGGYDEYWAAVDVLEATSHGYGGYVYDAYGNKLEFNDYRTDCITDYALEYLDTYCGDDEKPFFLFLSHIEPHHQNDHDCFEGPNGSRERFADFVPPPDLPPGEGDWEKEYPDYLGCCNALDHNLGRVLDKLEEIGQYDNTIVIFTTDHGCHFKTKLSEVIPGRYDDYKRNCYENIIHIPMVIRGPSFGAGIEDDRLVSLIDIPRTIIDAAGGDADGLQGDSLLDTGENWKQEVYIQISETYIGRAIRTNRYTYCIHALEKDPWHNIASDVYQDRCLFDNLNDPTQKQNLIDDPAYAEVKERLREKLIDCARKAGEGKISIREVSQSQRITPLKSSV